MRSKNVIKDTISSTDETEIKDKKGFDQKYIS
jgi:hypothetical protein